MNAVPQPLALSSPDFRILIVDDDRTNRQILTAILRAEGYAVIEAGDGETGVRVFCETQPDMVLMDVIMPVMDGYTACEQIKAQIGERFVPVIFLTGLQDETSLARCVSAGGDDFLSKPYNRTILKAKIEALARVATLYSALREQHDQLSWHQTRLHQDHLVAEQVLKNAVHSDYLGRGKFKHLLAPSTTFNGDLILLAPTPSGGINVMLGDFTGHGLSAAIGAIPVSEVFYGMTAKGFGITDIAKEINRKLYKILPTNLFLAAGFLHLDQYCNTVHILNAGIPDIILLDQHEIQRFGSQALPLGIVGGVDLGLDQGETLRVHPGSRFYLYSDGVIEAQSPDGDMFGQARLESSLRASKVLDMAFDSLLRDLAAFRQESPQADDITAIEIVCDPDRLDMLRSPEQLKKSGRKKQTRWSIHFDFQADSIREIDPLPLILQNMTEIQGFNGHRENLYTILAELYSNALEHGVLEMDSSIKSTLAGFTQYYAERAARLSALSNGFIRVDIEHTPIGEGGKLLIRFCDSGKGFDHRQRQAQGAEQGGLSGRGLLLLTSLCDSVQFLDAGNITEVVYLWS